MKLQIVDLGPVRGRHDPGSCAELEAQVRWDGGAGEAELELVLYDLDREVARERSVAELAPGRSTLRTEVPVPATDAAGYRAELRVRPQGEDGAEARAATAVLVASHWTLAPRYGFLSEFPPDDAGEAALATLARYHLTGLQFYDWMYRHYRFLPPEDPFVDALGRPLALATVRRRIEAARRHGMASMAYAAVYGAEPEFTDEGSDWVWRDAAGRALSLVQRFMINDLRPEAPWRAHLLAEAERAVREVGFDGVHLDQYGFPKRAYLADGRPIDVAPLFAPLIDAAAEVVTRDDPERSVLFNAVNDWPSAQVAHSRTACAYIEVWPPHERYRHLSALVRSARETSGKQAILAAYVTPVREGGPEAEEAVLYASAVIAAAGGFHLLVGEGDAVLGGPYFPDFARLRPEFARRLRRYYDHTAALHRYLFDPGLHHVSTTYAGGIAEELVLEGAPAAVEPLAGHVWVSVKQGGSSLTVDLVNLTGLRDERWDAPQPAPAEVDGLELRISSFTRVASAFWASPDDGSWTPLEVTPDGAGSRVALPRLQRWGTLVLSLA